ncbi:hypothetical protein D3C84_1117660 [compost metagenome]
MNDKPHVGLIDAHAEGVRRYHDAQFVEPEFLLHLRAFRIGQPAVILPGCDAHFLQ